MDRQDEEGCAEDQVAAASIVGLEVAPAAELGPAAFVAVPVAEPVAELAVGLAVGLAAE